jgi:5-bromo-4-chloroindolyl phosphate hydrolysis protein
MTDKGGGKLHDIKETASDAVEIMRELGTPGVRESFDIIKEVTVIAKEIMETMKTPEWQQNMENIRIISENMNNASTRMDRITKELKETGVIDDTQDLIKAIKNKMGSSTESTGEQKMVTATAGTTGGRTSSSGITGQDLKELSSSFKEMLQSIKTLVEELRTTMADSKKSGTMHNIEETFREATDTYRTVKQELEKEGK